jgi:hypothetical protein
VIRPVLMDVQLLDPAEMLLAWPGTPTLWCRIRLSARHKTKRAARIEANERLAAYTRAELQLIRSSASEGPHWRAYYPAIAGRIA